MSEERLNQLAIMQKRELSIDCTGSALEGLRVHWKDANRWKQCWVSVNVFAYLVSHVHYQVLIALLVFAALKSGKHFKTDYRFREPQTSLTLWSFFSVSLDLLFDLVSVSGVRLRCLGLSECGENEFLYRFERNTKWLLLATNRHSVRRGLSAYM